MFSVNWHQRRSPPRPCLQTLHSAVEKEDVMERGRPRLRTQGSGERCVVNPRVALTSLNFSCFIVRWR